MVNGIFEKRVARIAPPEVYEKKDYGMDLNVRYSDFGYPLWNIPESDLSLDENFTNPLLVKYFGEGFTPESLKKKLVIARKNNDLFSRVHKDRYLTDDQLLVNLSKREISILDTAMKLNAVFKDRFLKTGAEKFWDGSVTVVSQAEIMDFALFVYVGNSYKYVKSEINRLAWLFRKREGLSMKLAFEHAWFWARRQKFDLMNRLNEMAWYNFRNSRVSQAELRRFNILDIQDTEYAVEPDDPRYWNSEPLGPEIESYWGYQKQFDLHQKLFYLMIAKSEGHAPRKISKTWHTNIGNQFSHWKYGICEIIQHKKLKDGWFVIYQPIESEKTYKMEINKFRQISHGGIDIKITYSVDPDWDQPFARMPHYFGPDLYY